MSALSRNMRLGQGITAGICAALLAVFAVLSYSAAVGGLGWPGKSATWDEPEHLLGSYLHRHHKDFRVNPEDPALFGWIASIPLPAGALRVDTTSESFRRILDQTAFQWPYIWLTLYHTGGNDPDRLMNRARAMSTLVGTLLGVAIAWWGYQLGGTWCSIIATLLYAFCPNFLAHSSLVKNDVMLSAAMLGLMFALWRFGRRGTWFNFAAVALLTGAAVSVKYSGVLGGVLVIVALLIRALLAQPWSLVGMMLQTRWRRLAAAGVSTLAVALVAYGFVWLCYGFRFAPTPDPGARLNMARAVEDAKTSAFRAERIRDGRGYEPYTPEELESLKSRPPAKIAKLVLWLDGHKLLPQAWLYGFLYTYGSTQLRGTYLMGEIRETGWWYYFPLAMLFKTPLATLAAAGLALLAALVMRLNPRRRQPPFVDHWSLACLLIMPLMYGISAMMANLNLGLRHMLPVYPFVFIGTAIVLARLMQTWRGIGPVLTAVLAVGLIAETIARFPHYIAFFNAASGGPRGGLRLLGDSNLDWGQDLKLLAQWQRANPSETLYLSYFGVAEPGYYGINAVRLPGYPDFLTAQVPTGPGILAISATNLQGIYIGPIYAELLKHEPLQVLGGSIYLYRFPLTNTPAPNAGN